MEHFESGDAFNVPVRWDLWRLKLASNFHGCSFHTKTWHLFRQQLPLFKEMLVERSCSKTNLCRDYGYTKLYKGGGSEFCASQEAFRSISLFFEFMRAAQDNITTLMELDDVIGLDWI